MSKKGLSVLYDEKFYNKICERAKIENLKKTELIRKAVKLYLQISSEDLNRAKKDAEKVYNKEMQQAMEKAFLDDLEE